MILNLFGYCLQSCHPQVVWIWVPFHAQKCFLTPKCCLFLLETQGLFLSFILFFIYVSRTLELCFTHSRTILCYPYGTLGKNLIPSVPSPPSFPDLFHGLWGFLDSTVFCGKNHHIGRYLMQRII